MSVSPYSIPPEPAADWPAEMEADLDEAPPAPSDDFDLSRLWRRVRRERAAMARLKAYLARVTDHVREAIARREAQIAWVEQVTIAYLAQGRQRKAVMPDIGTIGLVTRRSVDVDAEAALAWASEEGRQFVLLEPRLDLAALKKHVLATGEVVPGVVVKEVTSVAFRPR